MERVERAVRAMIDPDDPLNIVAILFGAFAGIIFLCSQYEICIAMPESWFAGFSSGIVLAVCMAVLLHRRQ